MWFWRQNVSNEPARRRIIGIQSLVTKRTHMRHCSSSSRLGKGSSQGKRSVSALSLFLSLDLPSVRPSSSPPLPPLLAFASLVHRDARPSAGRQAAVPGPRFASPRKPRAAWLIPLPSSLASDLAPDLLRPLRPPHRPSLDPAQIQLLPSGYDLPANSPDPTADRPFRSGTYVHTTSLHLHAGTGMAAWISISSSPAGSGHPPGFTNCSLRSPIQLRRVQAP